MNKSVKNFTFVGLDHQYTPEKYLQQIDALLILTMTEQPFHLVTNIQWHNEKNGTNAILSFWNGLRLVFATSWKLQKRLVCFCICFQKPIFFTRKLSITHKLMLEFNLKSNWKYAITL